MNDETCSSSYGSTSCQNAAYLRRGNGGLSAWHAFCIPGKHAEDDAAGGADLFVRLAFKAARKYPKECRQTRLDIDHRILKAIREWKDQA